MGTGSARARDGLHTQDRSHRLHSNTNRVNMVLLRLERPNAVVRIWLVHEFKWRGHAVTKQRIPRAALHEVTLY
jgi:hypothetical protein